MSIIKVNPTDVENFTLVTTPRRTYTSSSLGVTGSVKVFPRLSSIQKDTRPSFYFNDTSGGPVVDINFDESFARILNKVREARQYNTTAIDHISNYFDLVAKTSQKEKVVLDVERFTPTTRFTKYTLCKNNIKDMLMQHYRVEYPTANWAYTNYNTLNFFTAYSGTVPLVPTASVLLYPNAVDVDSPAHEGYVSGSYCLSGAFGFDFYINPRYSSDGIDSGQFKAGTILHLSSCYSVSLISGSSRDESGNPDGFRLQLQLSHSADVPPSLAVPGVYPNDLTFISDDNSLTLNHWHHVVVRWGTKTINDGTGSFWIDGVDRGKFVIPSGTVSPKPSTISLNPDVLCVGNYYEGTNNGVDAQCLFFSPENALRDGVDRLTAEPAVDYEGPAAFLFRHPLKAEIHDLAIRRHYVSDFELQSTGSRGIGSDAFVPANIAFYVPPFFVEDTTVKRYVGDRGGVLQTPFFSIDGTTDDPFNVAMAFGVNGHYINLDNFVKDFATNRFPRLLCLTASTVDYTTAAEEANHLLYKSGAAKRNLTILPCDDGNFDPNYEVLLREDIQNRFTDNFGTVDYSLINLDDLVNTSSLLRGGVSTEAPEDYVEQLYGPSPEFPGLPPGDAYKNYIAAVTASLSDPTQDNKFDRGIQRGVPLTIYQRLLDPSSNQVTIFNISNLYYGRRILPGSFSIRDTGMSGSFGSVSITLRDDGMGNIYRGDAATPHSTQASVGNIFYDEGIVLIKSPHLYFFGKHQYEMMFKGVQNIYSTKYEILAPPGLLNSSSNLTVAAAENRHKETNGLIPALRSSGDPTDNEKFVYISSINFHDENMNVVAKANLAQPVMKREGGKILFKVAFTW